MARKCHFLRELVECGLIQVRYKKGTDMSADLFMKNLAKPEFEHLAKYFIGKQLLEESRKGK